MLIERQTKKPAYQRKEAFPDVSLAFPRQVAKPTSNKPAIMSKIQFNLFQFIVIVMTVVIAFSFQIHFFIESGL